jgi:hypothetical protein
LYISRITHSLVEERIQTSEIVGLVFKS